MQPLPLRIILMFVLISVLRLAAQESVSFTKKDGILAFPVTQTFVDSKGIVWVGSNEGLNAYTGSKWHSVKQIENKVTGVKQPLKDVRRIYEDRKRNLWFVTGYGVFLYDGTYWVNYISNEEESDYNADVIFEDRRGWIWVTQEYRQEFNELSSFDYTLISGSVKMFDGYKWHKFDDDVAESVAVKFNVSPTYVTRIIQDRAGNMWFATLEGLYMFDGKDWVSYKDETFKVKKVFDILEDKSGNIWAATEAGIAEYQDGQWEVFDKNDGLTGNTVYKLQEDRSGNLWAFSRSDIKFTGVSKYQNEAWEHYNANTYNLKGEIKKMYSDLEEQIFFSSDGISSYNDGDWHHFKQEDGLEGSNYSIIYRDKARVLWTANEASLYRYTEGKWENVFQPEDKWDVTDIYVDNNDAIWVGTDKSGLYVKAGAEWKHFSKGQDLEHDHVSEIFEDKKNNIWVITKKGITRFSNNQQ